MMHAFDIIMNYISEDHMYSSKVSEGHFSDLMMWKKKLIKASKYVGRIKLALLTYTKVTVIWTIRDLFRLI